MGTGRKRKALIQYATPDIVPADLQVVAAINYSGGTPPDQLQQVSSHWYNPGDTIPGRYERVGAVTYNWGDAIPPNIPVLAAMEPDPVNDAIGYGEIFANPGFETAGAGGADVFASWTETASDGAIADETILLHGGAHAAKLTAGANRTTSLLQQLTSKVVGGMSYILTLWAAGDGANPGRYHPQYLDGTWKDLLPVTSTGVTAEEYAEVRYTFNLPPEATGFRVALYCPNVNGGICYFDDVSLTGPTG